MSIIMFPCNKNVKKQFIQSHCHLNLFVCCCNYACVKLCKMFGYCLQILADPNKYALELLFFEREVLF